jgi:hypothetical protein
MVGVKTIVVATEKVQMDRPGHDDMTILVTDETDPLTGAGTRLQ